MLIMLKTHHNDVLHLNYVDTYLTTGAWLLLFEMSYAEVMKLKENIRHRMMVSNLQ